MTKRKSYLLEEIVEKFIDYRGKTPQKTTQGIPLITAKIVKNGRLLQPTEFIAKENYASWMTRGFPQVNDIVLTTEAPLGEVALIKDTNVALSQRIITLQTKKDLCDSIFLKYYLQNHEGQASLLSRASGTTVEGIKAAELKKIQISLPPLPEQKAIASILSSLDDKIDLLHRQNKALEAMAETLFRQWFVEEASEEWDEIPLSGIAFHIKNNVNPSKFPSQVFKHYSLPAFDEGKNPKLELGKDILSNKYRITSNSILVSKLNPRTPRIWPLYGLINEEVSICSTEFQVVKPTTDYYFGFIYCLLESKMQELSGAAGGTSGSHQRINPEDIFNLTFMKPSDDLIKNFAEITHTYWSKIDNNQTQIHTLKKLRDTLLPKLMSGEIRMEV